MESAAELINSTPGAKIKIPATKFKIKKLINPLYEPIFYVLCPKCKNHSPTVNTTINCESCNIPLNRAKSKYFVYIPIEDQLKKSINDNFDGIISYSERFSNNGNTITDVQDCYQFKEAQKKHPHSMILSMTLNTDGAQLFNSSNKSIWPIQIILNCLHPSIRFLLENIIVVALHSEKPNMTDFFFPLLKELKEIQTRGGINISHAGKMINFIPIITMCTLDLPAKAALQEMVGHTGYKGCSYCLHPGVSIKPDKNSKAVVRYVKKDGIRDRTHNGILRTYQKLSSSPIDGIKAVSCMVAASEFDLINGYGIDYLHCALLGVMKKLLDLWLNSKNHNKAFYLHKKSQEALNNRIVNIKPVSEITRKPGSIFVRSEYKGNEYRTLMLYYLRYSLKDLLPMRYIDHFHLLSSSIYILLKESISQEMILLAENRLNEFAILFESLYGQSNVTMNLHLLRHIPNAVRNLGPLWTQSTFLFETNNGELVHSNQAKKDCLHQISWKYVAKCSIQSENLKKIETDMIDIGEKSTLVLNANELLAINGFNVDIENNVLTIYKFIKIRGVKITSLSSKKVKTVDYFIEYRNNHVGMVKFYFVSNYIVYAFIENYTINERIDHLFEVTPSKCYDIINVKEIKRKMIHMDIGKIQIATSIPNKYEKP